ncbi:MAG: FAD-dependent oxidoreductase, partial [Vulcanimicrobiaceae bacterium]
MVHDVAIVGGGIVGLAVGRELLSRHPHLRLLVLEKEPTVAAHQTGHNSGVIHSGLYYAPGSLKARLCTEGRRALWRYCDEKQIEYRQVGKLIVATEEGERAALDALMQRGVANGIDGLVLLDGHGIERREPHCRGIGAIFSPVTGIVDYGAVARSYGDDIREMGGSIQTGRRVLGIERRAGTTRIRTDA